MRRAGQNPTDVEVQDMVNKIDDGSGVLDFDDFLLVMREKSREVDLEIHFKDAFRAFSKDDEGKWMAATSCRLHSCRGARVRHEPPSWKGWTWKKEIKSSSCRLGLVRSRR